MSRQRRCPDFLIEFADFYEKHKILCHVWAFLCGAWVSSLFM